MAKEVLLVALGGASSSGKTTLAKLLHSVLENSILLHQDDFYKKDNEIPIDPATGYENWDCPESINFPDFIKELEHLKTEGRLSPESISYKNRYNSDTNDQLSLDISDSRIVELKKKLESLVQKRNLQVVFVDGFMLFHDPKLIKLFDLKLFLIASYKTLKDRRCKRSGYQTQESFWVDPPDYFDKIVYPAYSVSHSYLFQDHNVQNLPDESVTSQLEIKCMANNSGTDLMAVFRWGVTTIIEFLENKN